MSEERQRSRSRREILEREARCIYCQAVPTEVDHVPPRGMFIGSFRPSGLEFAACSACNQGTSAADNFVSFLARLQPFQRTENNPLFLEAREKSKSLDILSPGLREEFFDRRKSVDRWARSPAGILQRVVEAYADGPLVAGHLATFAGKLGMALYREHVKAPLPLDGAVFIQPFLNGGLSQAMANGMLSMLPGLNTLQQGKFEVGRQFVYRHNSDSRSIVAALASFHSNIFFFVIATSDPETYRPVIGRNFCGEVFPGRLLEAYSIASIVPPILAEKLSSRS